MRKLAAPPNNYSQSYMSQNNSAIESLFRDAHKNYTDIEMRTTRIILTSANGTRYAITVSDAGALGTVAV